MSQCKTTLTHTMPASSGDTGLGIHFADTAPDVEPALTRWNGGEQLANAALELSATLAAINQARIGHGYLTGLKPYLAHLALS
jgi:hypothetical protein